MPLFAAVVPMAGIRRVLCDKQRDVPPFEPFDFCLQPVGQSVVPMWIDGNGDTPVVADDTLALARDLVLRNPGASANKLAQRMHCTRKLALRAISTAKKEQEGEACAGR